MLVAYAEHGYAKAVAYYRLKELKTLNNPIFTASFNNTWELPFGFMLGLDSYIQSAGATQNIYSDKPNGYVNVLLRKSFLNDALSVELRGNDFSTPTR